MTNSSAPVSGTAVTDTEHQIHPPIEHQPTSMADVPLPASGYASQPNRPIVTTSSEKDWRGDVEGKPSASSVIESLLASFASTCENTRLVCQRLNPLPELSAGFRTYWQRVTFPAFGSPTATTHHTQAKPTGHAATLTGTRALDAHSLEAARQAQKTLKQNWQLGKNQNQKPSPTKGIRDEIKPEEIKGLDDIFPATEETAVSAEQSAVQSDTQPITSENTLDSQAPDLSAQDLPAQELPEASNTEAEASKAELSTASSAKVIPIRPKFSFELADDDLSPPNISRPLAIAVTITPSAIVQNTSLTADTSTTHAPSGIQAGCQPVAVQAVANAEVITSEFTEPTDKASAEPLVDTTPDSELKANPSGTVENTAEVISTAGTSQTEQTPEATPNPSTASSTPVAVPDVTPTITPGASVSETAFSSIESQMNIWQIALQLVNTKRFWFQPQLPTHVQEVLDQGDIEVLAAKALEQPEEEEEKEQEPTQEEMQKEIQKQVESEPVSQAPDPVAKAQPEAASETASANQPQKTAEEDFTVQSMLYNNQILSKSIRNLADHYFNQTASETEQQEFLF